MRVKTRFVTLDLTVQDHLSRTGNHNIQEVVVFGFPNIWDERGFCGREYKAKKERSFS